MLTRGKPATVLAYAAGILDGEGSICIQRIAPRGNWKVPHYVARLSILNTDADLMNWLTSEFGGKTLARKPVKSYYKTLYTWDLTNGSARDFCEDLLPYLIVKRPMAELLVEYMASRTKWAGGDMTARRSPPPEEIALRDDFVRRMNELNGHPQRLSEAASRTDEAIV